jgi:N-acylneuraminate cytidylyltransferase
LPSTIQRAWNVFKAEQGVDSLRAVEKVKEHPGKMWVLRGKRMMPLLPFGSKEQPWHSTPYQGLPEVYSQNASLEMAWSRVVFNGRTIAGEVIMPFISEGYEGFDVNHPYDWGLAEKLVVSGEAELPKVDTAG